MSTTRMTYFEEADVLHLALSSEPEASSVELSPNVTAELNEKGELIGLEILDASSFVRDTILDSAQAKLLDLAGHKGENGMPVSRQHGAAEQVRRYLDRHGWDVAEDEALWREHQCRRMAEDYAEDEW